MGDICNVLKCPKLMNSNSNALQMSQKRLANLRGRAETARKAWRFKKVQMEEMISKAAVELESAKSKNRKYENDLGNN